MMRLGGAAHHRAACTASVDVHLQQRGVRDSQSCPGGAPHAKRNSKFQVYDSEVPEQRSLGFAICASEVYDSEMTELRSLGI